MLGSPGCYGKLDPARLAGPAGRRRSRILDHLLGDRGRRRNHLSLLYQPRHLHPGNRSAAPASPSTTAPPPTPACRSGSQGGDRRNRRHGKTGKTGNGGKSGSVQQRSDHLRGTRDPGHLTARASRPGSAGRSSASSTRPDSPERPSSAGSTRRRWKPCASPLKLPRLGKGRHVLRVKGMNALGVWEAAPSKRRFKVVGR